MTDSMQIALSNDEQVEQFEQARDQIAEDAEAIGEDVRLWGGTPTDGETVRVLAAAYTGDLSIDAGALHG